MSMGGSMPPPPAPPQPPAAAKAPARLNTTGTEAGALDEARRRALAVSGGGTIRAGVLEPASTTAKRTLG